MQGSFTRIGSEKVPDAKTMGRWGTALGPSVILEVHDQIVHIARRKNLVQGRRMRVDTTVVERNIHYPTDSSLLGDGVRVLTRTMKRVTKLAGAAVLSCATEAAASRSGCWTSLERPAAECQTKSG